MYVKESRVARDYCWSAATHWQISSNQTDDISGPTSKTTAV